MAEDTVRVEGEGSSTSPRSVIANDALSNFLPPALVLITNTRGINRHLFRAFRQALAGYQPVRRLLGDE